MVAPGLPLPELWDRIIGFIPPTPALTPTLKHLALVCRTFAPAAQRSLFRRIFIEDGQKVEYERPELVVDRRAITGTVVAGYLADLLASSPHLLPFIHELKVKSRHAECYHILSTIPWVSLRSLYLTDFSTSIPSSARSRIASLLSMSSLRRLEISGDNGFLPSKRTAEWIEWILLSCSADPEFLILQGIYIEMEDFSQGTIKHTSSSSQSRARLRELSLENCKGVHGLLLYAFDFTLRRFQCSNAYSPDVVPFMHQIGSNVEHLVVSSLDPELEQIDLAAAFPSLTTISSPSPPSLPRAELTFDHSTGLQKSVSPPASSFNAMLRTVSTNNKISRIVFEAQLHFFRTTSDTYPRWFKKSIAEFEEIAVSQLHALQVVEVQVDASRSIDSFRWDEPYDEVVKAVRNVFPILHQRGLLSISSLSPSYE
ncbi:hypothetical protein R3P38DRAFT_3296177 [Favolaschia claudopus]|uniref:F-box domain-containing protein n=1 Tax=Favolaschia claudopus TaxID=2862362 RepID=A0AAV9Z9R9_9AGAR